MYKTTTIKQGNKRSKIDIIMTHEQLAKLTKLREMADKKQLNFSDFKEEILKANNELERIYSETGKEDKDLCAYIEELNKLRLFL